MNVKEWFKILESKHKAKRLILSNNQAVYGEVEDVESDYLVFRLMDSTFDLPLTYYKLYFDDFSGLDCFDRVGECIYIGNIDSKVFIEHG